MRSSLIVPSLKGGRSLTQFLAARSSLLAASAYNVINIIAVHRHGQPPFRLSYLPDTSHMRFQ